MFDMAIITVVLVNIAWTLPKIWAYRVAGSTDNTIKNDIAGAVTLG